MKVLQIIDSLATGGAEKLLLESLPLYRKAGIEMDLLVLKDQDYPFMKALEELNCCKIYKLGTGSVYNPLHVFKIAKILPDYDLAHVHLFPAQYWVVMAKQVSGAQTQLVFTEHNTYNKRISNKVFAKIDHYFYRSYALVIAISKEIEMLFKLHSGLSDQRFKMIPNGVDLSVIKHAIKLEPEKVGLAEVSNVIIQVSAFRAQKDQATLIRALTHLPKEVKLLLVGDGPLRKNCEELTQQLGLDERVVFLGNRTDVPRLLKTADLIVLSSHYEGMSLSSIEGMASGRPFVASDVPGLSELVNNAGLLFPVGDEKALASLIEKLLSTPELYRNTIEKCLKRAEQFDIQKMVNRYKELYENIIN